MQEKELVFMQQEPYPELSSQQDNVLTIGAACNIVSLALTCFTTGLITGIKIACMVRRRRTK